MSIASSTAPLPRTLPIFRRIYPHALLRFTEGLFQSVERYALEGRIDFYVGVLDARFNDPNLIVEPTFGSKRRVVARKGHPLLAATSLDELGSALWLRSAVSDRSGEADFEDLMQEAGLPPPE